MYLVYDTETTGFPKKDLKDPENPHITQLAWTLFSSEGKPFEWFDSLVKPDGWEMPSVQMFLDKGKTQEEADKRAKFWVDNGFTQEKSMKEGRPIKQVMETFHKALQRCEFIIAHNMNFDLAIVSIEMIRLGIVSENKPKKICTMQQTTDLLQLPGPHGFKWPNLAELHNYLFQCGFDGAHNAQFDVNACAKCFFELKKRNLLNLN